MKAKIIGYWAATGLFCAVMTLGAAYSHAALGEPIRSTVVPLVVLAAAVASYVLRPAARRLAGAEG